MAKKGRKVPAKVQEIRDFVANKIEGARSVSFSQLSLYCSCPSRWNRFYRLNEVPDQPNINLSFGTGFHETIQEWLQFYYENTLKAAMAFDIEASLLEHFRSAYAKDKARAGKDFTTPAEMQEYYEDGCAILEFFRKNIKKYFDKKRDGSIWYVGSEIPIYYNLKGKAYYKGFVDALVYNELEDRWLIIDFKTSRAGWAQSTKVDFLKTSQVVLYKKFLSEQFNIPIDNIDVEYLIVKRKVPEDAEFPAMRQRVQIFSPANKKPSINKAYALVESFLQGALNEDGTYRDRDYETNGSVSNCKYCVFKNNCRGVIL